MNTALRFGLLSLGLSIPLSLATVRAQDNSQGGDKPPMHQRGLPPDFAQLNLTDAQKASIQQINKEIDEERRQKINAILTPEQQTKMEALRAEHHNHFGGGAGGNPPPAQ